MEFCTSIHCIDGRIQEPLIRYIKENFNITYVDCITEPGACKVISEMNNNESYASIINRAAASVRVHGTKTMFISGHYDCLANPVSKEEQVKQISASIGHLQSIFDSSKIVGLWIDENGVVSEINL